MQKTIQFGLVLCLLTFVLDARAQKKREVSGEFQMKVEQTQSIEIAKQKVCDHARVQAMEEVFGRVIFQGNSTLVENIENGQKTQTNSVFNMLADTYVNAEWIEDVNKPVFSQQIQNNELWVTCKVKGLAKELASNDLKINVATFDCLEKKCQTIEFTNGESLFLSTKSPKDGYFAIFLDDRKETSCVYPYQNMGFEEYKNFKFEAQKDYLFFSKAQKFKPNWHFVDELIAVTDKKQELDRFFILFSENPIHIPVLNNTNKHSDGTFIPRSMPSEEFQLWLQKIRAKDKSMHLELLDITIKNH